jgi:hypothetical protein
MPRAHVYSDERRGALLTSPATILSLPPASDPANHRFITPLFSASSESLFYQLLCFHTYLRCPLVFLNPLCARYPGYEVLRLPSRPCVPAKSFIYRFCADFAANPFIYRFYANTRGCGVPVWCSLAFRAACRRFFGGGTLSATSVLRSYCTRRLSSPPLPRRTRSIFRALPVSRADR